MEKDNIKLAKENDNNNIDKWRNSNKYLKETKHLETIWSNAKYKTNEDKIIALLKDYTKNYARDDTKIYSAFLRFCAGHWNRNHVEEIHAICKKANNKNAKDLLAEDLLAEMKKLILKNQQGTVAITIDFISKKLVNPSPKQLDKNMAP